MASVGAALGRPVTSAALAELQALPSGLATPLAALVERADVCIGITNSILAREPSDASSSWWGSQRPLVDRCARLLSDASGTVEAILDSFPTLSIDLNLWPVLRLVTTGEDDVHAHDYVITIDTRGDDVYANNAGGNLIDVLRGPEGSVAPQIAPARGCHWTGDIVDLANLRPRTDPQCVPAAALLLDLSGDDAYGVWQAPAAEDDAACTADPVVRRVMTSGAGFAGAGVLIDGSGDDTYRAKTASQGAGHFAGVGILHDRGYGDDHYLAIRSSQGFGLFGGAGYLTDEGGDDIYNYYMPAPLDRRAPYQTPGSGGVIDDTGLCDSLPRQVQGTGLLAGIGVLHDRSGDDSYRGTSHSVQDFQPGVLLVHGSQAFASGGGGGVLIDTGGDDVYRKEDGGHMPDRYDNHVSGPGTTHGGSNVSIAFFVDRAERYRNSSISVVERFW